jgi:hypothetical protein
LITNKKLLNKKEFIKGSVFPANIDFTPEEADRFIDYIVDESVLKNNARIVRMDRPEKLVRTLGMEGKILHPASTFSSLNYMKDTVHHKDTLSVKKARGCVVIYDDDIEDNIEGDAFVDHLMKMIASGIANNLEEAYYVGVAPPSGTSPLDLNGLWDGWRHRMLTYENDVTGKAHILDGRSDFTHNDGYIVEQNGSAPYDWEFKFAKMLKQMPSKYKKLQGGLANFRFFLNDQLVQDYIDSLAARSTILGDNAILGKGPLQYGTVPLVSCPLLPTDLPYFEGGSVGDSTVAADAAKGSKTLEVASGTDFDSDDWIWIHKTDLEYKSEVVQIDSVAGTTLTLKTALKWDHDLSDAEEVQEVVLNGTDAFLTHRDNLVIGIKREMKMESQREAADEATYFFYSLRSDLLLGNPDAVVFTKNLRVR